MPSQDSSDVTAAQNINGTGPAHPSLQQIISPFPGEDCIIITQLKSNIDYNLYYILTNVLKVNKKALRCRLFIQTGGGLPDPAYRIARAIRNAYPAGVTVVVGSHCKSAGTMIAICGNSIAIGDSGELGPLDIQVQNTSEIKSHSSALNADKALQIVKDQANTAFQDTLINLRDLGLGSRIAAELAVEFSTRLVRPLYSQIDPNKLGELQRNNLILKEYGTRLDKYGFNLKPKALDRLVGGYPCHSFVIDRKEATELFNHVRPMDATEVAILEGLIIVQGMTDGVRFFPAPQQVVAPSAPSPSTTADQGANPAPPHTRPPEQETKPVESAERNTTSPTPPNAHAAGNTVPRSDADAVNVEPVERRTGKKDLVNRKPANH